MQSTCSCLLLLCLIELLHYEARILQGLLHKEENPLNQSFNFSIHYIDDTSSLNNPTFNDCFNLVNPNELNSIETTDTPSLLFLDPSRFGYILYTYDTGLLKSELNDKEDEIDFPLSNTAFLMTVHAVHIICTLTFLKE